MLLPARLCEKCGKVRDGGKGRRYCPPCALARKIETQDEAMERFKSRNPDYWVDYFQDHKGER